MPQIAGVATGYRKNMGAYVTTPAGRSRLAERIGSVYSLDDVSTHLAGGPWPREEVAKRAEQRMLVAFRTDDEKWAFPAWGFDIQRGLIEPRPAVIELWRQLPHGGILSGVDLAAWMNTSFQDLAGSPVGYVAENGFDAIVASAVSRLRSRALQWLSTRSVLLCIGLGAWA